MSADRRYYHSLICVVKILSINPHQFLITFGNEIDIDYEIDDLVGYNYSGFSGKLGTTSRDVSANHKRRHGPMIS